MGSIRFYLALMVIALGIVAVQVGAYFLQRNSVPSGSCSVAVCTLISYGNSTMKWYNETSVIAGWNFYNLTISLTGGNVEAQFYGPPLNEHLVTGINGVKNQGQLSWSIWLFCGQKNGWIFSTVGADEIHLATGEIIAWAYGLQNEPPISEGRIVDSCP